MQETPVQFWVGKVPWKRDRLPTPVLGFPGAQLVKNLLAMAETWVQSLDWEDPLEKAKATHSSILARKIPWASPWGRKESDATEWPSLHFTSRGFPSGPAAKTLCSQGRAPRLDS